MSRQMAFQLSGMKLLERAGYLAESYEQGKYKTAADWLNSLTTDPKERAINLAVFSVMKKCTDIGRKITAVKQIIGWRGPDGKPQDLEVQWDRN